MSTSRDLELIASLLTQAALDDKMKKTIKGLLPLNDIIDAAKRIRIAQQIIANKTESEIKRNLSTTSGTISKTKRLMAKSKDYQKIVEQL